MEILTEIHEVRSRIAEARRIGQSVALVPTMGAFHDGHLSLMRQARRDGGLVVVSLFVNPTQFGPNEDLSRYPRDREQDAARAGEAGVDLLFAPDASSIYPDGFSTFVHVEGLSEILEGASRPGHFRGVTTVVAKLFQIVAPNRAYFGQKDYQQLRVIQRMTRDLDFPLQIVPMPIVREPDGLAMSSRNVYLTSDQRREATVLHQSLQAATALLASGETAADAVRERVIATIATASLATLDTADIVDAETLAPVARIERPAVLLLAVRFGATRLIDNAMLVPESREGERLTES